MRANSSTTHPRPSVSTPPRQKGALVSTARVLVRDRVADEFARGWWDTSFQPKKLMKKHKLDTPEKIVDWLGEKLLAAPLTDEVRSELIAYMGGEVSETKFSGVAWLIICSPDFQRN